jgi:hypothetical protein
MLMSVERACVLVVDSRDDLVTIKHFRPKKQVQALTKKLSISCR